MRKIFIHCICMIVPFIGIIITSSGQTAEEYFNLGITQSNKGNYKAAINNFNKSIELKPNRAVTYYNRGIAKGSLGDYDGAILDFSKAIEIHPNAVEAYYNRGYAKHMLKNEKGACLDWHTAYKLGDSDAYTMISQFCN